VFDSTSTVTLSPMNFQYGPTSVLVRHDFQMYAVETSKMTCATLGAVDWLNTMDAVSVSVWGVFTLSCLISSPFI
jgi:hypothetical protein